MKSVFLFAAVLAFTPAANAETRPKLYGNLAGVEYCRLRSHGISADQAFLVAVEENLSSTQEEAVMYNNAGGRTSVGVLDMVDTIKNRCPQYYSDWL